MFEGNYSSRLTLFYKYVPTLGWIILMGWQTRELFLHQDHMTLRGIGGVAPPGTQWLFLALWIAGAAFMVWVSHRTAWLRIADGHIYIRRFRREEQIDPRSLQDVDVLWSRPPAWVTIKFLDVNGRSRRVWVYAAVANSRDPTGTLQKLMEQARVSAA